MREGRADGRRTVARVSNLEGRWASKTGDPPSLPPACIIIIAIISEKEGDLLLCPRKPSLSTTRSEESIGQV